MKAIRFRVQNFRNIDDSGWIDAGESHGFCWPERVGQNLAA